MDLESLQLKLIYTLLVAGKSAEFANDKIARLFWSKPSHLLPFDQLCHWHEQGVLEVILRRVKTGNYDKLLRAFAQLITADLDLETCGPDELEAIHGIGPKTARFFIVWSRPAAPYAVLDVHVLRWLRQEGYAVPVSTPQKRSLYKELELVFLKEAKRRGMTPRELDLQIWEAGARTENRIRRYR
jgi:endonuclease III